MILKAGRRAIRYIAAFSVVVCMNFFLPRAMPGDPLSHILGEDVQLSESQISDLRAELGLDLPMGRQFLRYLGEVIRFDLGYSYHYRREVAELIGSRLRWTLALAIPAILLGAIVGSITGAIAGFTPGKTGSKTVTAIALALYSMPPYFIALILLYLGSFRLGWFPLKGYYTTGGLLDVVHHLILPVLVLTLFTATRNFAVMRGSVMQERMRHYVTWARAKGVNRRKVLFGHVFRNASLPLVTILGLDFGFILSGALFVEIVFSMNGMGTLIFDSVQTRDYPVLQGAFLTMALMVMIANFLSDQVYRLVDPRIGGAE